MAHLDSESSDFEEDDYNETNVLLGYASSETYDDIDCHLGGQPVCEAISTSDISTPNFFNFHQELDRSSYSAIGDSSQVQNM